MTILDLLHKDNIQPKKESSTNGGEYSSPCPVCGGRDRFRVWPEEGDGGKWWCRGCNTGGDLIQYLRDIRNMSYSEACDYLGVERKQIDLRSTGIPVDQGKPQWTPREAISPNDLWVEKHTALVEWCQEQLWSEDGKSVLEWLHTERGLTDETIMLSGLGWNPKNLYRERKAWGVPEEIKENGKTKKLWISAGLLIPLELNGILARIKIKRCLKSLDSFSQISGPPFCKIPGSSTEAMILGKNEKIFIVVESELDAILLNQEIGDMAGVIALGSAQARPDKLTTEILGRAELILVSLDNDKKKEAEGGENTGAKESREWWLPNFTQAKRIPPIIVKDHGEMWKVGIDLKEWAKTGIEISMESKLPKQPETLIPTKQTQPPDELIGKAIEYLDGIDEDLTGWTLWSRKEKGGEYRFALDQSNQVRWERNYVEYERSTNWTD